MARFIRDHQEWLLGAYAVGIIGVLIGLYTWGVGAMITEINTSLTAPASDQATSPVDTAGAQAILKARGIEP